VRPLRAPVQRRRPRASAAPAERVAALPVLPDPVLPDPVLPDLVELPELWAPRALAAPAPGWTREVDVLVVGSGVAGLSLARALAGGGLAVDVVSKGSLGDGSTRWAQGGIASADGPGDAPGLHLDDTLTAGAGLCDPEAVRTLVTDGPAAVADLVAAGARFDASTDPDLPGPARTVEGGHSRARIVHAGGDATGAEVQRALQVAVRVAEGVTVHEHTMLLDLLSDRSAGPGSPVTGALLAVLDGAGRVTSTGLVRARATVLATGGWGQVFASTTNPAGATGDGLAAALRAGAPVRDLEFVQFHPTVLHVRSTPLGRAAAQSPAAHRTPLLTEALRGEGAVLVDVGGTPVMAGAHPLADLAPRDVVSATMARAMAARGVDHLFLDARGIGPRLEQRFPTVVAGCRAVGIDPLREPVPVAPAAHYACGGIRADMAGRTPLPGLYAIGEVACTGVHGANRLASNSLLEGLVVGRALAALLLADLPPRRRPEGPPVAGGPLTDPGTRADLAARAARDAGVLRDPAALGALLADLAPPCGARTATPGLAAWEATNLRTVTTALVAAALTRAESRGCHRRTDVDGPRPQWLAHVDTTLEPHVAGASGPGRLVRGVQR